MTSKSRKTYTMCNGETCESKKGKIEARDFIYFDYVLHFLLKILWSNIERLWFFLSFWNSYRMNVHHKLKIAGLSCLRQNKDSHGIIFLKKLLQSCRIFLYIYSVNMPMLTWSEKKCPVKIYGWLYVRGLQLKFNGKTTLTEKW